MDTRALPVRVLVVGPTGRVVRAGCLTPDLARTIVQDALHGERAVAVDVMMPATASDQDMDDLRDELSMLLSRGTRVSVRRSVAT